MGPLRSDQLMRVGPRMNGIIKEAHQGRTQGTVQLATWEEGPHQNLTLLAF